jgi:hypothetical protein
MRREIDVGMPITVVVGSGDLTHFARQLAKHLGLENA